ncbi:MAG TPA: hypothetical protein VE988_30040 [Gemmataceae bacterium]|nr:hypothetical protein [Gemmataceae bacterium]
MSQTSTARPIPIGVTRVAGVRGAVWKVVDFGQCRQRYAYLLELEATGSNSCK